MTTKKITDISFSIEENHIEFNYKNKGIKETAYLQLPNSPDSIHRIGDKEIGIDNKIYKILEEYFYDQFDLNMLASMSCIIRHKAIMYKRVTIDNEYYYTVLDENQEIYLLKQRPYSDCHDVELFEEVY